MKCAKVKLLLKLFTINKYDVFNNIIIYELFTFHCTYYTV